MRSRQAAKRLNPSEPFANLVPIGERLAHQPSLACATAVRELRLASQRRLFAEGAEAFS